MSDEEAPGPIVEPQEEPEVERPTMRPTRTADYGVILGPEAVVLDGDRLPPEKFAELSNMFGYTVESYIWMMNPENGVRVTLRVESL